MATKDKESKLPSSLGPNIGTTEWVDKKVKQLKMAEFGSQIKSINKNSLVTEPQRVQEDPKQNQLYKKRMEYAKQIPKPKVSKQAEGKDQLEAELDQNEE